MLVPGAISSVPIRIVVPPEEVRVVPPLKHFHNPDRYISGINIFEIAQSSR